LIFDKLNHKTDVTGNSGVPAASFPSSHNPVPQTLTLSNRFLAKCVPNNFLPLKAGFVRKNYGFFLGAKVVLGNMQGNEFDMAFCNITWWPVRWRP
jgi:hypothetical protein